MSNASGATAVAPLRTTTVSVADGLAAFELSPARGCLPSADPLLRLPPAFDAWEALADDLPALRLSDRLPDRVRRMPLLDVSPLRGSDELERAMAMLSFIAQACAAATDDSPAIVPANLAVPWDAVARRLGRRAEMSYASAVLHNWRRIDADRPIEPGNLAVLHRFTGDGGDEAWFLVVQVAVESAAAGALATLQPILRGAAKDDVAGVTRHLHALADALDAMFATLARLGERCDRYVWELRARRLYQPVRMTLEQVPGGKNPASPPGPDLFCRSTPLAAITALLRIDEESSTEPAWRLPAHASFVQHVRRGADLRRLLERPGAPSDIRHAFNRCAAGVARFRAELDDWLSDALLPVATDDGSAVPGSPR